MQEFEQQAQAFANQIEEELQEGRLNFPTALDVSLRIKKLADNPESTLDEIAAVVRAEPVLSAKVVRMANAVLLNPYGAQITAVNEAVKRIGLSALRCLAFAVAAEQLAQDHRSREMRLVASGLWMHTVDVAAWSYAFARHLRSVNPDTAMLAGMMVDIGQFFLLARAADFPALEHNMARFAEFVSTWDEPVGRAVLEAFELPETILDAFQYEDPYGGSWPPVDLADIVFTAGLAAETPNPFDTLLGLNNRGGLLAACTAGIDKDKFSELVEAAREGRQELISAVVG
ncbi:HDOD domain-containing protein [Pseudothauera lacus]|uniref:Histidine kinase n=1 Tax=Pseudothauera lacus TaxID=2136175 RepID=A0A2T4IC27_9RHOO|nr:HDOD domain-containing protein [Pseudothauera lacus]PTD95334.1 histidine kinase [Pseudothauera lacus]